MFLQSYCMPILCNDVLLAVSISCFVSWLLRRLSTKHFSSPVEGSFLSARAPKLKTGFRCVKLLKWVSWCFILNLSSHSHASVKKLGVSPIVTFQIPSQVSTEPLWKKEYKIFLEAQRTSLKWMFVETTISYVKIWNHPIETTISKWLALGFQMNLSESGPWPDGGDLNSPPSEVWIWS